MARQEDIEMAAVNEVQKADDEGIEMADVNEVQKADCDEDIERGEENVQKDEEDTPKKASDDQVSEEIDLEISDNLLFIRMHCCCVCYGSVVISVFCILMFSIVYFLFRPTRQ